MLKRYLNEIQENCMAIFVIAVIEMIGGIAMIMCYMDIHYQITMIIAAAFAFSGIVGLAAFYVGVTTKTIIEQVKGL